MQMRMVYIAFWVFVGGMLLWQFATYNNHIDQKLAAAGPQQQHFYFNNKSNDTKEATPPPVEMAIVKQVSFTVEGEKPTAGSFTCHVTLKNVGSKKAVKVQVQVSPFKGVIVGDVDGGRAKLTALSNSDPAAQVNEWIEFPDLAPGQSITQDVTFLNNNTYLPGDNSNPKIMFETEQSGAGSSAPTFPSHL